MKNNIVCTLLILSSLSAMAGNKIKESKVPEVVKNAFKAKFPDAKKIQWELENDSIYEAEFVSNKVEMSSNFSATGRWLETEKEIDKKDIPDAVLKMIAGKYAGYKIVEAESVDSPACSQCYEVVLKKGKKKVELLLNKDGNILTVKDQGAGD